MASATVWSAWLTRGSRATTAVAAHAPTAAGLPARAAAQACAAALPARVPARPLWTTVPLYAEASPAPEAPARSAAPLATAPASPLTQSNASLPPPPPYAPTTATQRLDPADYALLSDRWERRRLSWMVTGRLEPTRADAALEARRAGGAGGDPTGAADTAALAARLGVLRRNVRKRAKPVKVNVKSILAVRDRTGGCGCPQSGDRPPCGRRIATAACGNKDPT